MMHGGLPQTRRLSAIEYVKFVGLGFVINYIPTPGRIPGFAQFGSLPEKNNHSTSQRRKHCFFFLFLKRLPPPQK